MHWYANEADEAHELTSGEGQQANETGEAMVAEAYEADESTSEQGRWADQAYDG